MLQVSVPSLLKELANNTDDPTFNKAFTGSRLKPAKNNPEKEFPGKFFTQNFPGN